MAKTQSKNTLIYDNNQKMYYASSGNTQAKLAILFVHGTPGGWDDYRVYLTNNTLQKDFFIVAMDRPGWGKSTIKSPKLLGKFSINSNAINAILKKHAQYQWIIVGHSLGASIAPQAMIKNRRVKGLLLLAGSLKPRYGKPRWFNYIAAAWPISKLIPNQLQTANKEVMRLSSQLKPQDKYIRENKFSVHLLLLHGKKDTLVSPKNADYVEKKWCISFLSCELIRLAQAEHYLPWQQTKEVIKAICSGLIEMDTLIKDNIVNYWSPYESKTSIQELPKRV